MHDEAATAGKVVSLPEPDNLFNAWTVKSCFNVHMALGGISLLQMQRTSLAYIGGTILSVTMNATEAHIACPCHALALYLSALTGLALPCTAACKSAQYGDQHKH